MKNKILTQLKKSFHWIYKKLSNHKWGVIACVAAFLRFLFGVSQGVWFNSEEMYDDALLAQYALEGMLEDGKNALLKLRGYPMFLNFVHTIGIPYAAVMALLWIALAFYAYHVFSSLTKRKWAARFIYFYVLFYPTAFELMIGTRLYRNSVLVLLYACTFLLMLDTLHKRSIVKNIALGFIFTCTYLIKEDGMWIVAVLGCYILAYIVRYFPFKEVKKKNKKKLFQQSILIVVLAFIPFGIFYEGKQRYLDINESEYGVRYLQTRTDGEFGEFVNNIYKIKSKNRTETVWAPSDAIEKAFNASKTLSKNDELLEAIENNIWFGDINEYQIPGDFLAWVLRDALNDTGMWESEKYINTYFEQVNDELDEAFESGELQEDDRIQLLPTTGGKTWSEIFNLRSYMKLAYKGTIFLEGYQVGGTKSEVVDKKLSKKMASFINTSYLYSNNKDYTTSNKIVSHLFTVYRIVNVILQAVLVFVLFLYILDIIQHRKKLKRIAFRASMGLLLIFLILLGLAYSFSISWFVSYLGMTDYTQTWQIFYCTGLPAIYIVIYGIVFVLFDTYIVRAILKSRKTRR